MTVQPPDTLIAAGAHDGITIRFTSANDDAGIGPLWTRLERQFDLGNVMCSWNWTETWLHHYGDRVDYRFAVGERHDKTIGIALITCPKLGKLPTARFRGIVHIGTAGEPRGHGVDVEYNRLLAAPDTRGSFASSLIDAISRDLRPFAISLDGFIPEDMDLLRESCASFNVRDLACPTFDLERARDEALDVVSAISSSGVRSRVRRSNRGFDGLQGEWATDIPQALDIYDELITLHQARWTKDGRPGAFASDRFAGFHREFITRSMGAAPQVMLFRLRHDATTIGCLYGFIENGMVLFYQSGFIDVSDNRLKPGLSTHVACMQQCLDRGLRSYNFLAGEARYKRELANSEHLLQSAIGYRFARTESVLGVVDRLGLIERARAVKRWRERRSVSNQHAGSPKTRNQATSDQEPSSSL